MGGDLGGQVLGENTAPVERPQVQLQRLTLDAVCAGNLLDVDRVEVRLFGGRAQRSELRGAEVNEFQRPHNREGVEPTAGNGVGTAEDRLVGGRNEWGQLAIAAQIGLTTVVGLLAADVGLRPAGAL